MNMKRNRNCYNYKKIWIENFGKIPKDENCLSYEIHHINGNPTDDRIENLMCISIQEHFNIHLENGDFKACQLIAGRMNNPSLGRKMGEEYKKKQSIIQKRKVLDGTHHLLGGTIQKKTNRRLIENGIHPFQNKDWHIAAKKKAVESGTNSLLKKEDGSSVGGTSCKNRIKNGTHHFQDSTLQTELSMRAKLVCQKAVLRISLDGTEVKEYDSVRSVLNENPNYKTTIYRKIANNKEYYGYIWKYK